MGWDEGTFQQRVDHFIVFISLSMMTLQAYLPVVKQGHLADPSAPLDSVEGRLSTIRGHLVEAQLNFLSEETDWTSDQAVIWSGLDPAVVVYT